MEHSPAEGDLSVSIECNIWRTEGRATTLGLAQWSIRAKRYAVQLQQPMHVLIVEGDPTIDASTAAVYINGHKADRRATGASYNRDIGCACLHMMSIECLWHGLHALRLDLSLICLV